MTAKQANDSETSTQSVFAALDWVDAYQLPWAWCTVRVPSGAKCWSLNLLFRICFQSALMGVRCLRWARRRPSPQSSRGSALTRIMRVLLKPRQKLAIGKLERFRQPAMRVMAPATSDDLLAGDSLETVDARAKPRYVWIARKSLRPEQCRRIVFYIHGGGFAKGDLAAFHHACATYSAELNALVAFPLYGLCPEHTLEQVVVELGVAYRSVRLQFPAMPLVMMADSAGGLLAVLLARTLQEERIPLPQALVLFSPLLHDHLPEAREAIARVRLWLDEQGNATAIPRDSLPASS